MYRVYEVIEVLPNGSHQVVTVVSGLEFAKAALEDLAKRTPSECFAVDARTRQIVMQMNVSREKLRAKRVFQIAYAEEPALQRTDLLKSLGYSVMAVIGSDAAKSVLRSIQQYDLFIVADHVPEGTRREMVDWLKAHYPGVKVLALNPPNQQVPSADYNAPQDAPENWLPIISKALAKCASTGGA